MKDLFCIDFDFLGIPVKIFCKTYTDEEVVRKEFHYKYTNGGASFHVKPTETEYHAFILFNDSGNFKNKNIYKNPALYAHELLHSTKFYMGVLGIENEEVECLFLGYLVKLYCNLLEQYENNRK